MLLLSAVSSAFGGTIVRDCYGTVIKGDLEKVSQWSEAGDAVAVQKLYDLGFLTVFQIGEKVEVEKLNSTPDLRKVRRKGDITEWYIPLQCVSISY
jgi:hypothetical protein